MNKVVSIVFAGLIAVGALAVSPAKAADWTYVSGGYTYADAKASVNNRDVSADAVFGEVSVALTDWAFVQGRFDKGMDQDFDTSVVGVSFGLNRKLDERTDLYGKVTASSVVENRYAYDKYAYEAEVGLRAQVTERVELRGGVIATELRDARLDSVRYLGTAGVEFALTPSIRLGLDVRGKDNLFEGQAGVRLYF